MIAFFVFTIFLPSFVISDVYELDERFSHFTDKGPWLVKFYAPWCGFCRKLSPTYTEVSRILAKIEPLIKVARIDATIHSQIAKKYDVNGFPSIKYINGTTIITYTGDRSVLNLVSFAQRAFGPAVKLIESEEQLEQRLLLHGLDPIFILMNNADLYLEKIFKNVAELLRMHCWFVQVPRNVFIPIASAHSLNQKIDASSQIIVLKDQQIYHYSHFPIGNSTSESELARNLATWVWYERHRNFPELNSSDWWQFTVNSDQILNAIWAESDASNKPNTHLGSFDRRYQLIGLFVISSTSNDKCDHLLELGRLLAFERLPHIVRSIQLAWTREFGLLFDMAMETFPLPNIVLLDPVTHVIYPYSLVKSPLLSNIDRDEVINFFMLVNENRIQGLGGNTLWIRLRRLGYNFVHEFLNFVQTNPFLALLIMGVPAMFITFICYICCCMADYDDGIEQHSSSRMKRRSPTHIDAYSLGPVCSKEEIEEKLNNLRESKKSR